MIITKELLERVDKRSELMRHAMMQAGDKLRIQALREFLISIGACELTVEDVGLLNLPILKKEYGFMRSAIYFVPLEERDFERYVEIKNTVRLEVSHIKNKVIGLRIPNFFRVGRPDSKSKEDIKC